MAEIISLQTAHVSHSHASGQTGIFTEDLLDASPTRIAADVDNGGAKYQSVRGARSLRMCIVERPSFVAHCDGDAVHQLRIPCGAHCNRHREECGRLLGPDAMQRLVPATPHGNAKSRDAGVRVIELPRFFFESEATD